MFSLTRSIRRHLGGDSGVAMAAVIGIIAVSTILVIAAYTIARGSLAESQRIQGESQAFLAADAGLEAGLATVSTLGFRTDEYGDPLDFPMEKTLESGSYVVTLESIGNSEYKATSVGYGPDGSSETLVNRFFFLNMWEMNLALGTPESLAAGSGGLMGNSMFYGPLYVRGTFEMGNSHYYKGPLFVYGGDITGQSDPGIGLVDELVDIYLAGTIEINPSKVFARSISKSVPEIPLPIVSDDVLSEMWTKSRSESIDNIMGSPDRSVTVNLEYDDATGDTYLIMDPPNSVGATRTMAPDATLMYKCIGSEADGVSGEGEGVTSLTIGGTGSWGFWEGNGYDLAWGVHDDFAFDDVNKVLYLEGTVFVDGPLTFNGDIRYVGNGTIFTNGDITINDTLSAQTTYGHVDEGHALGLATPTDIYFHGTPSVIPKPSETDRPDFSGAFFCQGTARFRGNSYLKGSIIAGIMEFDSPNSHLITDPNLPSFLPDSLPGDGAAFLARGNWTRQ